MNFVKKKMYFSWKAKYKKDRDGVGAKYVVEHRQLSPRKERI